MNFCICDDEPIYRQELQRQILAYTQSNDITCRIQSYSDPEVLLANLHSHPSDAFFLDIQMPRMNGLTLAQQIRAQGIHSPLIFVSAHADYMQSGYEVRAFRYLLKSQIAAQLPDILNALVAELAGEFFQFTHNRETVSIPHRDILYLESIRRHINVVCAQAYFDYSGTLESAEAKLPTFIRAHKGFLLNPAHIRRFSSTQITLTNDLVLPIGRKYAAATLAQLTRQF